VAERTFSRPSQLGANRWKHPTVRAFFVARAGLLARRSMAELIKSIKRFLSVGDLADRFQVERSTIYTWMRRGQLPPPVRFSRKCLRWDDSSIEKWIEARKEVVA